MYKHVIQRGFYCGCMSVYRFFAFVNAHGEAGGPLQLLSSIYLVVVGRDVLRRRRTSDVGRAREELIGLCLRLLLQEQQLLLRACA